MRRKISVLFSIFSVIQLCRSSFMDNPYHRYCRTNIHGDQDCFFTVAYWFNFVDFRQWLDKLPGPLGDVSLHVHCIPGAYIHLPFPYRARNLKKLKVKNCLIRNFMSEWKSPSIYPDSLEVQEMDKCELEIDFPTMQDVISSTLNKQTICGQETLVKLAMRNITYKPVVKDSNVQLEPMFDLFDTFQEKMKSVNYLCNYNHLEYLERSGDDSRSKTYMEDLTDKSHYPRLKTIKMASDHIVNFPAQFKNWREYFPALRSLDLFNNSLQNFSFEIPHKNNVNYVPLVVNLRRNEIQAVPSDIEKYLSWSPIILDVRENPIECDCKAEKLGYYLRSVRRRFPLYKELTEFVCKSPSQVKDVKLIYINYEKCSQDQQI